MRLITHNFLICNKKGVVNGFPLGINAEETEVIATEYNEAFVLKMIGKIDWNAFIIGAKALQENEGLPEEWKEPQDGEIKDKLLRRIHHVLLDIHVKKGSLICPESGREFPIIDGIPNMLLHEDEV